MTRNGPAWLLLLLLIACSGPAADPDLAPPPDLSALADLAPAPDLGPLPDLAPVAERPRPLARIVPGVHGLAMAPDRTLFFSDSFANLATMRRVYRMRPPYTDPAEPTEIQGSLPAGLLYEAGQLYVCDTQAGTVRSFDGATLMLGKTWRADAPWNVVRMPGPTGAFVTVSFNGLVQELQMDGSAKTLFSMTSSPFAIAPESASTLWLSEQKDPMGMGGRVTLRDSQGRILRRVMFDLQVPEGLLYDATSRVLWIADTGRGRVLRLRPGGDVPEIATDTLRLPIVLARSQGLPGNPVLVNGAAPAEPNLFQVFTLLPPS